MTIVFTYPDTVIPDTIDWRINFSTQVFVSPFDKTTQTAEIPGARWSARLNYSNLQQDELRVLSAFFIQLRGMSGRFTLYDLSLATPQSGTKSTTTVVVSTKTVVEVADATGLTVGDYLEITPTPDGLTFVNSGPELKMITDISGSDLTVEPPFRVTPSASDVVSFDKAKTIFMLDTDDQTGWNVSGALFLSNFTISCMEIY